MMKWLPEIILFSILIAACFAGVAIIEGII